MREDAFVDERTQTRFSRRILLRGSAGTALVAILSACSGGIATETPVNVAPTVPAITPTPFPARASSSAPAVATDLTAVSAAGQPVATANVASASAMPVITATPTTGPTVAAAATGTGATATIPTTATTAMATGTPTAGTTATPAVYATSTPFITGRVGGAGSPSSIATARGSTTNVPAAIATGTPNVTATPRLGGVVTATTAPPRVAATAPGATPIPVNVHITTMTIGGNPSVSAPTDLAGKLGLKRLTIALPPGDDSRKLLIDNQDFLAHLRVILGIEIVGAVTQSYADSVEALRGRKVDLAFLNPVSYILAHDVASADPLMQAEQPDGRPVVNNSFIIARVDSNLNSLTDLRGKTFAIVDGDPLAGHWVPSAIINDRAHLVEGKDYTTAAYGAHIDAYGSVVDKRQEMGAIANDVFQAGVDAGAIDPAVIKVLDTSFDIPQNLIAIRNDVPPTDQDLIALAILSINELARDSRLYTTIFPFAQGRESYFGPNAVKFRRVDDGFYAELRAAFQRINLDFGDAATKAVDPNARLIPMQTAPAPPVSTLPTATPLPAASRVVVPTTVTPRPGSPAPAAPATAAPRVVPPASAPPAPATAAPRPAIAATATVPPVLRVNPPAPTAPTATFMPRANPTTPPPAPAPVATVVCTCPPADGPAATPAPAPQQVIALPRGFETLTASGNPSRATVPTDLAGRLSLRRLTVALLPANDPKRSLADNADMLAYLRAALNIEVVGAAAQSPAAVLDALRRKSVDLAFLSAAAYIVGHTDANAQALVQGENQDGKLAANNTLIIARADSSFGSLGDLARANVGFVETDPIVGRVVPSFMLLDRARLTEGKDYTVTSTGSHADAYQAVLDGVIDAAAVASDVYQQNVDAGTFDGEAVKTLDTSFDIPQSVLAVRGDLSQNDQDILTTLFRTINEQPRDAKIYTGFVLGAPKGQGNFGSQTVKLRPGDDNSYNEVRNAAMRIGFDLRKLAR